MTTTWFEATKTGESILHCAEYCGTGHSAMNATVRVVTEEEFEEFLEEEAVDIEDLPLVELGEITFQNQGCGSCPSIDGTERVGHSMQGLYGTDRELVDGSIVTADEEYFHEAIVSPRSQVTAGYPDNMPTFYRERLSDREIEALIEYIKELQ